ncbi:uncharacterized protein LOC120626975 isoform X1 [Pararge aegeria]|uniref:uncharacterized protein LOC120626975 isoform X1 n=1 Tax=Pararge aegeria TaxID=116150 RepID=UPI0019CFA63F|nr:uncharacterized protein LOC120626975 isoform X1 [Pararge aegeria]XP_039750728.1 uncharacterized protein LOC120626975 isoform X1 [Pararge aegeria]XP_039750729.1 uncharacterized protein LOC120626975 isoform X1 [Pararge aegeria]
MVEVDRRTPIISKTYGIKTKKMKFKTVEQQVLSIVRTVLERCKKEKSSNCLQVPLEDAYERVSFYTALPKMFIYHVIDDNPYVEDCFDDNDHIVIMECINKFILGELNLSIKDLYQEFLKSRQRNNGINLDLQTFERKIYSLGYTCKKNLKGSPFILIEDPKIKFQRFNYLFKMKNYRENNKTIYYIDEKHIIHKPPFKNPVKDNYEGGKSKQEGLIFFHLISNNGYENGIYVSMDSEGSLEDIFKKWMMDIVLYTIKPGSVIVMANNFIHGLAPRKRITRYHSKKRMLEWLRENNIPCDSDMNKPRIYELIERCTTNNKDYDIDRIFKLHGHHVLRLPENFSSLTPTKSLWTFINRNFKFFDANSESLRTSLLNYIMKIEKSDWSHCFDQTYIMENRILKIDLLTEDLLEKQCELDEKCFYESASNFNIDDILE